MPPTFLKNIVCENYSVFRPTNILKLKKSGNILCPVLLYRKGGKKTHLKIVLSAPLEFVLTLPYTM